MICPICKSPNQPGGRFFTACGSQRMLTCSACGFANAPGEPAISGTPDRDDADRVRCGCYPLVLVLEDVRRLDCDRE